MTKPELHGKHNSSLPLTDERRRSQRVVISVPVTLHYTHEGLKRTVQAATISVNDQGAMVLCERTFAADAVIELHNVRTRQNHQCRITRTPTKGPQGYLLPLEFVTAASDFWRISFPPSNWKPTEE